MDYQERNEFRIKAALAKVELKPQPPTRYEYEELKNSGSIISDEESKEHEAYLLGKLNARMKGNGDK